MNVTNLSLEEFSVFREAEFTFSPGLNVLIGANATGKSHVMKLAYACLRTSEKALANSLPQFDGTAVFGHMLREKLAGVFKPASGNTDHLIRRPPMAASEQRPVRAVVDLRASFSDIPLTFQLDAGSRAEVLSFPTGEPRHAIFVPAREVMSMYEGFIGTYDRRELSFDETVYDLCLDLNAPPLRGKLSPEEAESLLDLLRDVLQGVSLKGQRFYVREPHQDWMEAHLAADGVRKMGTLMHLISNGALTKGCILFWDEPETNLNPKLITVIAEMLLKLAGAGVQVFVATHDYLLTNELSIAAEYGTPEGKAAMPRFFCLGRAQPHEPVTIQAGDTVADLGTNPILEEFAAHYDRNQKLFAQAGPSED